MIMMEGSPAKKQKQTQPMAITPPPLKRSYAAVVRTSLNSKQPVGSSSTSSDESKPRSQTSECAAAVKRPIIVEGGIVEGSKRALRKHHEQPMSSDVQPYLRQLDQALELEVKYRVQAVHPPKEEQQQQQEASATKKADEDNNGSNGYGITSGMRDGSAHVLRCLKVWYDLPSDVFFNAISSIDRFLAKMKAQPKHLSCIAVAAFHLACKQHQMLQKEQGQQIIINVPEPADLVSISQSRCSPSDLLRMQAILSSKLELNPGAGPEPPVTVLTMLRLMFAVSRAAARRLGFDDILPEAQLPDQLLHQLEILACDSLTLQHRPAEVALALLATDFQHRAAKQPGHSTPLMGFVSELQKYCIIPAKNFVDCLGVVVSQLDKYNSECTVAHRQRLVWKLSNRTLRHLRPTDKLRATLPTIKESSNLQRMRSASECSNESLESLTLSSEGGESDREMDIEEEEVAEESMIQWTTAEERPS